MVHSEEGMLETLIGNSEESQAIENEGKRFRRRCFANKW